MKRLTAFYWELLHDMGEWCRTSTIRDQKTVTDRSEHEGTSFLTISLPNFGKDFERSLDQGFVDHDQFTGFSRSGRLPRFLGGFLDQVFDRTSGVLLNDPSVNAIRAIRQLTLAFGKIELPCSERRTKAALARFVECEKELHVSLLLGDGASRDQYRRIGRLLWANLFAAVDLRVYNGSLVPKHGPGATAERLRGNAKYGQREWPSRLETYFPAGEYLFPSWRYYNSADVNYLEPGAERPVRVITVPKTLKTPRIIAIEPTCMQYVQQGLLEAITEEIRTDDSARAFICSDSQLPNRDLAREGSLTGALATLDLSEASDRVLNQHVEDLMLNHPHLRGAVQASRSSKADVLGQVLNLAKFASMGSALCFPIESMVFLTMVFVGIEESLGHHLTLSDVNHMKGKVRVYGDDIIVPVEFVPRVVEALSSNGMIVNSSKSFWTGRFRESCGGDFYAGQDVSLVKVRHEFPTRITDGAEVLGTVALRNHLFERGFVRSTAYLDSLLGKVLPVFPIVEKGTQGLGRWSDQPYVVERYSASLHKPLVRACVPRTKLPDSILDNFDALTKCFLKRGDLPFQDEKHLFRSGRPRSVDINTRWVSPQFEGTEV